MKEYTEPMSGADIARIVAGLVSIRKATTPEGKKIEAEQEARVNSYIHGERECEFDLELRSFVSRERMH